MKVDREEEKYFHLGFVYIFVSHSAKKKYLWIVCKKVVKSRQNNCGSNSRELAIINALTIVKFKTFSQPRQ